MAFLKKTNMAYTDLNSLKYLIGADTVRQLTDDNGTGSIDNNTVTEHIDISQKLIDGYLRGRYDVEMSDEDVPELIKDACTKLTAYSLYRRKQKLTMPETVMKDYKDSINFLKDIQKGKISPFDSDGEPTIIKTNKLSTDRIYTSTLWATYD